MSEIKQKVELVLKEIENKIEDWRKEEIKTLNEIKT